MKLKNFEGIVTTETEIKIFMTLLKNALKEQKEEIKKELLAKGTGGGNWRRLISQLTKS